MARITNEMRHVLCNKVLEKSQAKRDRLCEEIDTLSESVNAETKKMKDKALALISAEFDKFSAKAYKILENHGLEFDMHYSRRYTLSDIMETRDDKDYIAANAGTRLKKNSIIDKADEHLEEMREELKALDARRKQACDDVIFRVMLGAKYTEVVDLINSFEF